MLSLTRASIRVRRTAVARGMVVAVWCLVAGLTSGCAGMLSWPELQTSPAIGGRVAEVARSYVGVPYRFGGADADGFDCSGLVQFAYSQVGIGVPRTVREQYRNARPVPFARLSPGDLLFFKLGTQGISHVGIYAGSGRFVHAPRGGKDVSVAELSTPFWKDRLMAAGRYY